MPPLRERIEDVPLLAAHFIEHASRKLSRAGLHLTSRDVARLQTYDWPGNIRELQNAIERAVILSRGKKLTFDLPGPQTDRALPGESSKVISPARHERVLTAEELKQIERDNILRALEQTEYKVYGPGGSAELLKIKPTTLLSKMKALRISRARA
jgi:transcriptional regulator with GAF, ATPase, and Fis domain